MRLGDSIIVFQHGLYISVFWFPNIISVALLFQEWLHQRRKEKAKHREETKQAKVSAKQRKGEPVSICICKVLLTLLMLETEYFGCGSQYHTMLAKVVSASAGMVLAVEDTQHVLLAQT